MTKTCCVPSCKIRSDDPKGFDLTFHKQTDVQHVALENFSLAFDNQNVCNNENTNILLQNNITNNQLDVLMSQSVEANSIELMPQAVENCNELMLSQSEYVDYDKLILRFEEGSIDRVLKQNIRCESTESEKATTSLLPIDIEKLNLTKIEKEALNKAKTEIINLRRKNESLQMKLYRWKKRVKNADSLLYHMKSRASCNYSDDAPYSWSKQPFHPNSERYKNAPICSSGSRLPANNLICPVRVSSMPNGTLPDIETLNAAKDFLTTKLQEPFFLAVGFHKPHIPLKYPKKYLKFHPLEKFPLPKNYAWPSNVSKVAYNPWMDLRQRSDVAHLGLQCPWQKIPKNYAKKVIQSYYAAVTYVDNLIGKLLDQLEIVKISNNTIVVLTSDHGWSLGEHAEWAKYSNFDVSLRVPLIISIPEIDKKLKLLQECSMKKYYSDHKIVQEPVELLDIFPTIAELAGIPVIDCPRRKINRKITLCTEGSSLIPLIETSSMCKSVPWKGIAVSQYPRPSIEPICKPSSDKPRLRDIKIMGYTLRVSKYRYTAWISFSHISKTPNWQKILAEELYDHSIDFEENSNLANLERFQSLKHDLKSLLMKNF